MSYKIHTDRDFSFERKPSPVPGDLRIGWRIPLTLLMLNCSRGKKASLAKLNLLNDALRSERSREKLSKIIRGETALIEWRMRVEPAFARNMDLLTGGQLAEWKVANGKAAICLTNKGKDIADRLENDEESFMSEKAFLREYASKITEGFVTQILLANKAPS
ncbi:hypothetical protein [Salipiger mucosus]|uniref:hypothetical protein n=1 Tax=Salipiger mucosus TaxID=263378 RepID=UPI0012EBE31A|nr:hypothetical protein [Salipiger mucosus]